MKTYAAVPTKDGKYTVCTLGRYEITPVRDFRIFETFDEADKVAKDTAAGKYNRRPGQYVCMR